MENNSGITSLAGYAYQIKVFVYYSFLLNDNFEVSYELYDDVGIKKNPSYEELQSFNPVITSCGREISAIQVKHTSLSKEDFKKIIFNWIISCEQNNIDKYILFCDASYNNEIKFIQTNELFDEIIQSKKRGNAIIAKVKKQFENRYEDFKSTYEKIKDNFEFVNNNDIDKSIIEVASPVFRKAANETVFLQRLEEYMQQITSEIISKVCKKEAYVLNCKDFSTIIESITQRFTQELTLPNYSNFKKIQKIQLDDESISLSREYKQLKACNISDKRITDHLVYKMYYNHSRIKYLELDKNNTIDDIENLSYDNYCSVKETLSIENRDTPYNRLNRTKEQSNSFADNEFIKYGSLIYLTSDSIEDDIQISWKDEDNEG